MAKSKILNIKVKKKALFVALFVLLIISFIMMFAPVSNFIAGFFTNDQDEQAELGEKISNTAQNVFTGGVAVAIIWLAISVVSAPIVAIVIGAVGIAFALFTVWNIMNNQGADDILEGNASAPSTNQAGTTMGVAPRGGV